jgi:hypothetical protein
MSAPEYFKIMEGRAVFRPTGHVSLNQAVQMVVSAIANAREQNIRNLMTDLTALTGFASPSVPARYQLIKEGAQASGGFVRVAMVIRPEMMDPQKIGVLVGKHFGLVCNSFTTELEAVAWLQSLG